MKTYTTAQGDMWDSIAHAQLGSAAHTGELMRANPGLQDYYRFPAGITLRLPEIERRVSASLPPWKR